MPEEKDGYKMHMIVPKPTDPEKLKKREELSKRLKEYPNEDLKKALEGVQIKDVQKEKEKVAVPKPTDPEEIKKREELLERLREFPTEKLNEALELIQAKEKQDRKEEEERKARKVPKEIKDFRKKWEEEIKLDGEIKNKIIEATNRIAPEIEIESDGSRRIEMTIRGKEYKILDVDVRTYTDYEYNVDGLQFSLNERPEVKLGGMKGDSVDSWKNQKLKKYVKEKQSEKFHIPKIEEMRKFLNELGEEAGITKEEDQIALLQYLTSMYGMYWLSMGDDKKSDFLSNSRSCLTCYAGHRFRCYKENSTGASLLMLACEEV